jgi:glycerol kinase
MSVIRPPRHQPSQSPDDALLRHSRRRRLTRGAGRAHLVRATLESLAYQSRDVIDAMNEESGVPLRELRVDGGASSNDFLMQFQADVLGVPVDRPALVETTAAGAAFLAGLGVGLWKDAASLAARRRRDRLFTPAMPPERREALYAGWKDAVARVRSPGSPARTGG